MKKKITKWVDSIEEISIEFAVNDFFDGDWDPKDWKETEEFIDQYIEEEFIDISDKEKSQLKSKIKEEYNKKVFELKQKEINQLKDRKSILKVLNGLIDFCSSDWGEVGYLLFVEEILDLIIKNGNK